MKIGIGIITKNLDGNNTLMEFLDNAETYGHEIEEVIVGYAETVEPEMAIALEQRVTTRLVNVIEDEQLEGELLNLGIQRDWLDYTVRNPVYPDSRLLPYGMLRNNVILRAILDGLDYLVFIDTDVYPEVLKEDLTTEPVDFFGMHIKGMSMEDVMVTTSDYSGYYIIPKIKFEQLEEYLIAVGKERAVSFVMQSDYQAMCFDPGDKRSPFETDKILGGNLMIDLNVFKSVVPFFSSMYRFEGEYHLTRGEDTVFGLAISKHPHIKALDIDLKIRHDTYGDFPKIPDIYTDESIRNRFYRASVGWIGRNPFMYWVTGANPYEYYQRQLEAMTRVEKAFSFHVDDWRFDRLSRAIKMSYNRLNVMINQYNQFVQHWGSIVETLQRRGVY